MSCAFPLSNRQDNHAWLRTEFTRLLLAQEPASVLDVGCGAGALLRACRELGVKASGIDQASPGLDALISQGLDAQVSSASRLPFEDGSVDWVVLRHVPHHLEDLPAALAEAVRVAARGLLIAEPSFDLSLPCQRGALALDRWEKKQHRRQGMFHAEALSVEELLAALPQDSGRNFEVDVHVCRRLRARSIADLAGEAEQLLAGLPADHEERTALRSLLSALETSGLSWPGSTTLVLTSRVSAAPHSAPLPCDAER